MEKGTKHFQDDALNILDHYITSLKSNKETEKKADLLSYWIKDYVRLLSLEDRFEPAKNITYRRGDIVKINFGYRIGSEQGGLHYAVVIDENKHNSPVMTVIPLTSAKPEKRLGASDVYLGNELYEKMLLKCEEIQANSRMLSEISKMKEGSIAVVNQITTVSKIRIYDPRRTIDSLFGIRLSDASMDMINDRVKDLYIH